MLDKERAKQVIDTVTKELLTPFGLRTLSPKDKNYIGKYQGTAHERDSAYHNGTVWPWLLGHFTEAAVKVYGKSQAKEIMQPSLDTLQASLYDSGIGSISEVYSGDKPHLPEGCISQAWSVAELLRLTYLLGAA